MNLEVGGMKEVRRNLGSNMSLVETHFAPMVDFQLYEIV